MAIKVAISFKESEKDMYEFLQAQLSPSIYLKGLIKKEMENDKSTNKNNKAFDLDF